MKPSRKLMELSIAVAKKGVVKDESPFGAVIAKNGKAIVATHNTVLSGRDAIAHAEINAIHAACRKLKSHKLYGCTIYSTCEPCPMCFSAIHWAGIPSIIYGARIEDAKACGFHELEVHDCRLKRLGKAKVKIRGNFMRRECVEMMREWKRRKGRRTY